MSAKAYLRKTINYCKDVFIMSPQDEQWDGQVYSVCILQFPCFTKTTVCSQNINKQNVNIAYETLTDYIFLSM